MEDDLRETCEASWVGNLNYRVSNRKPVLASCGGGPLKSVVGKYQIGLFVEPDDVGEIVRGASELVPNSAMVEMLGEDSGESKHVPCSATELPATAPQALSLDSGRSTLVSPTPAWARYEQENSWVENARKVVEALCEQ